MIRRPFVLWMLAVVCGLSLLYAVPAQAAGTSAPIRIYLDGKRIESDVAPYIAKSGYTMVPVRVISQGLGASVAWTQKTKTVTVQKPGAVLTMKVGQKSAAVNGKIVPLDAPVVLTQGRVMVPLRFISERLGLEVKWNVANRWIQLISRPGHELIGAWISSVYNLDWPSAGSYGQPAAQQQEFMAMLDDLQAVGVNAVFVQVRPAGDALYPTGLAPWSKFLTGVQGQDPGYDPLAFMIAETHRRGMEFHAWFNPFRANTGSSLEGLAPNHVAVLHPDWIVVSGGKAYINPGIPAARQHIIDVVKEVVKKYDVDGVHLDDYFYPTDGVFDDDAAFAAYNPKKISDKAAWRRDNINDFVRKLGQSVHAAKPQVRFGISPFGIWRNKADDPSGSDTQTDVTAYDSMYADVRTWIRGRWIDYIMPQIYWSLTYPNARYDKLADWWANEVDGSGVKLYIGHALYKLGTAEIGWDSGKQIVNQLKYNESLPQIRGDVFFSAKDLQRNSLDVASLLEKYYKM